jgi:outer membrane receptor protein involved in Fe transport
MMHASLPTRIVSLCLLVSLVVSTHRLSAQGSPAAKELETPATAKAPITLSPFEVRGPQDHGYRAGSAITGTGTAGLIKDTPLNISIVSRELIATKAATNSSTCCVGRARWRCSRRTRL